MVQNFIFLFLTNRHGTNFSVLHWLFTRTRVLTKTYVLNTKREHLDFLAARLLWPRPMFVLSSVNLPAWPYYGFFFSIFIFPEGLDFCSCICFAICMVNARKLSWYAAMPVINIGTSIKNKCPAKKELWGCTDSFQPSWLTAQKIRFLLWNNCYKATGSRRESLRPRLSF